MFGKECFARMVMKYGKIRRNVIGALLSRKVGTQGPRFGRPKRWRNVGACVEGGKRKESMGCIRKEGGFGRGGRDPRFGAEQVH
jgi:hypothetical protein